MSDWTITNYVSINYPLKYLLLFSIFQFFTFHCQQIFPLGGNLSCVVHFRVVGPQKKNAIIIYRTFTMKLMMTEWFNFSDVTFDFSGIKITHCPTKCD